MCCGHRCVDDEQQYSLVVISNQLVLLGFFSGSGDRWSAFPVFKETDCPALLMALPNFEALSLNLLLTLKGAKAQQAHTDCAQLVSEAITVFDGCFPDAVVAAIKRTGGTIQEKNKQTHVTASLQPYWRPRSLLALIFEIPLLSDSEPSEETEAITPSIIEFDFERYETS